MYCKNCGSEMPDDAIFCSHCGTKLEKEAPVIAEEAAAPVQAPEPAHEAPKPAAGPAKISVADAVKAKAEEPPRKPFLEEMQWNVSEYPDSNVIEKTEDIDFDWNTDPSTVPDATPRMAQPRKQPKPAERPAESKGSGKSAEGIRVSEIFDRVVPAEEARAAVADAVPRAPRAPQSPAAPARPEVPKAEEERTESLDLGKFHTFNRKSAEFQQLLDKEYEKIMGSGTIGSEQSQADAIANERFDSRQESMTMEQFLEKEGAVKLYEPKPLESDVLARIEAQEKKRARQKAEEEARAKAEEEARIQAEAKKQADLARLNSEAEASAAAAEEIRLAEEAEIRRRTEEEAKRQAARQAAHLEAIAARQAAQEQAALQEEERRLAEEARQKAEAEEAARQAAAARAKAEAEAARAAEEAARRKAEAELNAAREAARARALEEARLAAQEEARFREEQERRRREEEAMRARQQERQETKTAVEAQVKDALAQTARMREEEEAKIKAALAGIRGGRFTDTLTGAEPAAKPQAEEPAEISSAAEAPVPAVEPVTAPAEPVATVPDEIEEAHQATRHQIDEMAKAREDFFADFPDANEISRKAEAAAADFSQTRIVSKDDLMSDIDSTKKLSREALHLDETPEALQEQTRTFPADTFFEEPTAPAVPAPAAPAAPESAAPADFNKQMDEMDALLNQFARVSQPGAPETPGATEAPQQPVAEPVPEETPAFAAPEEPAREVFPEETPAFAAPAEPAFGDEFSFAGDLPQEAGSEEPAAFAVPEETVFPVEAPAAPVVETPQAPVEDEIFEPISHDLSELFPDEVQPKEDDSAKAVDDLFAAIETTPAADTARDAAAFAEKVVPEKPGLEDTMVMPMGKEEIRGAVEAARQDVPEMSARERKKLEKARKKEAKRAAKEAIVRDTIGAEDEVYEEEPKKGGVGRTILMIILILLCIIFALELAGIGIKLLAPTSGAAEFIDNILNNLIHMITGSTGSGGGLA